MSATRTVRRFLAQSITIIDWWVVTFTLCAALSAACPQVKRRHAR